MSKNIYKTPRFKNIRELIINSKNLFGDNTAFKIKHKQNKEVSYENITYAKFYQDINNFGAGLLKLNLHNKKIAVIGKNSYEWALTYFTTLCGVGIIIPLDKGLPEKEIESLLQRTKADALIFEEPYLEYIKNFKKDNSTNVTEFICMQDIEVTDGIKTLHQVMHIGEFELENGNDEFLNTTIHSNEMNLLLFTSGTTSISKAAMLTQENITSNVYAINEQLPATCDDVNIAFLPFHHAFGALALVYSLSLGITNVFCDGLRHIQENLKEYGVTMFICVPLLIESIYQKIIQTVEKQGQTGKINFGLKLSKFLLIFGIDIRRKIFKPILDNLGGKLRFVISGASGIDKKVAEGFNNFGIITLQGYGLTETAPILASERAHAIRYGSIGYAISGVEIKIDNPNEEGIGELIAKGPNIMLGYYENEEATKAVLKDGWFYTGDLGYMDKDGFIFITGRKKNVIVLKNGKNVYPEELEFLLNKLPYVEESMVFGKEKNNDLVVSAKVVYNKDSMKDHSEKEIFDLIWKDIKEINKTLPQYKYIKNLFISDEPMIKTTTAKIKRYEEIKKIK